MLSIEDKNDILWLFDEGLNIGQIADRLGIDSEEVSMALDEMDFDRVVDYEDSLSDVEADADTLRSAGMGMDEDYGYFGDDEF